MKINQSYLEVMNQYSRRLIIAMEDIRHDYTDIEQISNHIEFLKERYDYIDDFLIKIEEFLKTIKINKERSV